MTGKAGSIGNNTGTTIVVEFGDILWDSFLYPKFGHFYNIHVVGMAKVLVDELIIEAEVRAHDSFQKNLMWTCRVGLILLDNLKVDVVKIFCRLYWQQKSGLDSCRRCMMRRVNRRPRGNQYTFKSAEVEGVCVVCRGPSG